MAVNEKAAHGGGRLPVVGGEDHTPAVGDHPESCAHPNTQSIGWGCGIREVHGFGQLHPYVCNGRMWEIPSLEFWIRKLVYEVDTNVNSLKK